MVNWYSKLYNNLGDLKKNYKKMMKILSDCCEAVIGAIYIDQGFEVLKNLF